MSPRLPEYVDPWRLADLGKKFSGRVALSKLPRLAEALFEVGGEASFELEFYTGEQGRACVEGRVQAQLSLQCQRCLDSMTVDIDSKLAVAFVHSLDESEYVQEPFDPVFPDEGRLRLLDLVEDELLLGIPQSPMHDVEECAVKLNELLPEDSGLNKDEEEAEENPFAVLTALKQDKTES